MDNNLRILSADEIFAVNDIQEITVPVPQWGGAVVIRSLTQEQAGKLRKKATYKDRVTKQDLIDNDMLEAMLFTESIVQPKFSLDDYEKLQQKSMAVMAMLMREIMSASGLSDESVKDATKSAEDGSDVEV